MSLSTLETQRALIIYYVKYRPAMGRLDQSMDELAETGYFVKLICTSTTHRGKGHASALMSRILENAKANEDSRSVGLVTPHENVSYRRLTGLSISRQTQKFWRLTIFGIVEVVCQFTRFRFQDRRAN